MMSDTQHRTLPTYWIGSRDQDTLHPASLIDELAQWQKAFWVDDYTYNDLLMLLAKHQVPVN